MQSSKPSTVRGPVCLGVKVAENAAEAEVERVVLLGGSGEVVKGTEGETGESAVGSAVSQMYQSS